MLDIHSIRPVAALRALRAVFADPDDTSQVFRLIAAFGGPEGSGFFDRFRKSRGGQRLLASRPELRDKLEDRKALEALPAGSLGRAYLAFMDRGSLSAEWLVASSEKGGLPHAGEGDAAYLGRRMRDGHDLWHVVLGYEGDLLGEASVLAFTFAQTWTAGIGLLVGAAITRADDPDARRLILDAFARGLRAAWLPAVAWEEMLARPLADVRAELRAGAPPTYEIVTIADLKAA